MVGEYVVTVEHVGVPRTAVHIAACAKHTEQMTKLAHDMDVVGCTDLKQVLGVACAEHETSYQVLHL